MVAFYIEIPKPNRELSRDFFLSPTGVYYTVSYPTLARAKQLKGLGVKRVVLPSSASNVPLGQDIADVLSAADIQIIYQETYQETLQS